MIDVVVVVVVVIIIIIIMIIIIIIIIIITRISFSTISFFIFFRHWSTFRGVLLQSDARIILGYPDPPARFAQVWAGTAGPDAKELISIKTGDDALSVSPALLMRFWSHVRLACVPLAPPLKFMRCEDDENTSEENDSNDTMSNDTMSPIGMLNDSDDSVNVPLEDLSGEDKRCFANVSVNVSLNVTGDVEPFVMVIEACSRETAAIAQRAVPKDMLCNYFYSCLLVLLAGFCNPATTCSGFGVCDPISQCGYSGGSSCSSTVAGTFKHMVLVAGDDGDDGDDDDDDAAAHLGNMLRHREVCAGDSRSFYANVHMQAPISDTVAGAALASKLERYPPGECFRRCEENVDCFEGSCVGLALDCCGALSGPTDSCGGKGFCADDGSCLCDIRNTGAECADSTAYELAELQKLNADDALVLLLPFLPLVTTVYCTTCNADNTRTCAITGGVEQCFCEEWWWGPDAQPAYFSADDGAAGLCALAFRRSELFLVPLRRNALDVPAKQDGLACSASSVLQAMSTVLFISDYSYYPEGSCDVQCDVLAPAVQILPRKHSETSVFIEAGFSCNLNGYCGLGLLALASATTFGRVALTAFTEAGAHDNSTDLPSCSTRCAVEGSAGPAVSESEGYNAGVSLLSSPSDETCCVASGCATAILDGMVGSGLVQALSKGRCTCSYPGTDFCREGRTGDGLCVCHYGWGGNDCERCAEGFFPAPETQSPSCTTFCSSPVTCSGHGMCNVFGICECDEGWAGVNCDRCADNWYPLGSCNVYCTFEETCSYHGRCNSDGICLCDDGWMTGTRSRYQYLEDMFSLDDLFPLGLVPVPEDCRVSAVLVLLHPEVQASGSPQRQRRSRAPEESALLRTSTSGEPTRAVEAKSGSGVQAYGFFSQAMINSSNASNDSEEEAMDGNGTDSDTLVDRLKPWILAQVQQVTLICHELLFNIFYTELLGF
ncbi:LanA [Symbiodinium microadriaticum]|nr:LanA [Symbiodinium microadriaticum]